MSVRPALVGGAVLVVSALLVALVVLDGAGRSAPPSPATVALVQATGLPDLFLSSSSRWLRHPSSSERAAALADAAAGLDVDPAGLAIGPPTEPLGPSFVASP